MSAPGSDSELETLIERTMRVSLPQADQDQTTYLGARTTQPPSPAGRGELPGALGRYPVSGQLGRGGMGEVLLVQDTEIGREMAAKVIRGSQDDALSLQKFLVEAQVTGQLEHPNIVPVHELGIAVDGRVYFTMKRIQGRTLAELLAQLRDDTADPAAHLQQLLEIFLKTCDAVAFAHSRQVIHRDLKPANIMVGAFGEVLVVDWGLAKVLGAEDPAAAAVSPDVTDSQMLRLAQPGPASESSGPIQTMDGQVMGTPAYMPPEQARGDVSKLDQRADIYALGAILYEMLTLQPPFSGESGWEILQQVLAATPIPPSRRAPGRHVPWELEAVVTQSMAREPEERYETVGELKADIEAFLAGSLLSAAQYGVVQRGVKWVRRNRTASLAVTAAAAALLVAVVGLRWHAARQAAAELAARERHFVTQARQLRTRAEPAIARAHLLDERDLLQRDGSPNPPAVAAWFGAHTRAAEQLEEQLTHGGKAPSQRAQEQIGLAEIEARLRGLCLDAAGQATALSQFTLARMWVARARLSPQRRRAQLEAIDQAERRRAVELRERGRAILSRAGNASTRSGFEFMLAELVRLKSAEIVKLLLEPEYLDGGDSWRQRLVYGALGRLGDTRTVGPEGLDAVDALIRRLNKVDPRTQLETALGLAYALGHLGDARAQRPLTSKRWESGEDSPFWRRSRAILRQIPLPRDATLDRTVKSTAQARELSQTLTRRGFELSERGELHEALKLLDRAIATSEHPIALNHRGVVLARLKKFGAALADFSRAIELAPRFATAWENRGNVRHSLKRNRAALADLDKAASIMPTANLYHIRGVVQIALGRPDLAAADFERALKLKPGMARALVSRGKLRLEQGQLEAAMADLRKAVALAPKDPRAHSELGLTCSRLGRWSEAITHFTRALSFDPRYANAHYNRGNAYMNSGRLADAETDYTNALAIDPTAYDALVNRGVVRRKLGKRADALLDYRRAQKLEPGRPDAYVNIGVLFESEQNLREAIEAYSAALRVRPKHLRALRYRAQARTRTGDRKGAIEDYTRYLDLQPRELVCYYNRGLLYQELGQLPKAVADYQAAVELSPDTWQPWVRMAGALWALGKKREAIRALKRGRECAPTKLHQQLDRDIVRLEKKLAQDR